MIVRPPTLQNEKTKRRTTFWDSQHQINFNNGLIFSWNIWKCSGSPTIKTMNFGSRGHVPKSRKHVNDKGSVFPKWKWKATGPKRSRIILRSFWPDLFYKLTINEPQRRPYSIIYFPKEGFYSVLPFWIPMRPRNAQCVASLWWNARPHAIISMSEALPLYRELISMSIHV